MCIRDSFWTIQTAGRFLRSRRWRQGRTQPTSFGPNRCRGGRRFWECLLLPAGSRPDDPTSELHSTCRRPFSLLDPTQIHGRPCCWYRDSPSDHSSRAYHWEVSELDRQELHSCLLYTSDAADE